eukprot:m.185978 g.185978  ORF g.185978 m.185978 type:complete len:63 (-) comp16616_c0_seq1:5-193(-)
MHAQQTTLHGQQTTHLATRPDQCILWARPTCSSRYSWPPRGRTYNPPTRSTCVGPLTNTSAI